MPVVLLSFCSKSEIETSLNKAINDNRICAQFDSSQSSNPSYSVSEADIENYLKYKRLLTNKDINEIQMSPIKDAEGEILLYIINYEEGWDLLAADKRATIPLCHCEQGQLDTIEANNPILSWIGCLAEDVGTLKSTDAIGPNNGKQIEYNLNTWKAITADPELFKDTLEMYLNGEQTRLDPPLSGHYELDGIHYMNVFYDSIPHLTQTWWRQTSAGCNNYIPYRTDTTYLRAPAGCTNVAGAQVLYYLHQTTGVPTHMPEEVCCVGDIDDYSISYSDMSDTIWSQITSSGGDVAGRLIAVIAKTAYTIFGNGGSTAYIYNLHQLSFPFFGVSSSWGFYDEDIVKTSLLNNMPVIVTAYPSSLAIYGHTFIIDGYYRTREEVLYSYVWVWDNYDPNQSYPRIPGYTEIGYTSPVITAFEMNWGWGQTFYDTHYHFIPSGDWMPGDKNYTSRRTMLYGFEAAQ